MDPKPPQGSTSLDLAHIKSFVGAKTVRLYCKIAQPLWCFDPQLRRGDKKASGFAAEHLVGKNCIWLGVGVVWAACYAYLQ